MGEATISQTGERDAVCCPVVSVLLQWYEVGNDPVCILPCELVQLQLSTFPSHSCPPGGGPTWLDQNALFVSALQARSVEVGIHRPGLRKGLCSRPNPPWVDLEVYTQQQLTTKKPSGNHLFQITSSNLALLIHVVPS